MNTEWDYVTQYQQEMDQLQAPEEMKARLKENLLREQPGANPSTRTKRTWQKVAALVAVACAMMFVFWAFGDNSDTTNSLPDQAELPGSSEAPELVAAGFDWEQAELVDCLPMVSLGVLNEGMGGGGLMAFAVEEFENGNPWTEEVGAALSSLPVFWNTARSDAAGLISQGGLNEQQMETRALTIAETLGLAVLDTKLRRESELTSAGGDAVYEVSVVCQGAVINVERNGNVEIVYDTSSASTPALSSYPEAAEHRDEFIPVTEELYQKFRRVLGWDNLTSAVWCDRFYDGQRGWWEAAYEKTGDLTEQILGFNFRQLTYAVEGDKLWILRFTEPDLSEKLGDYPLITVAEAEEALLAGRYVTTEPEFTPQDGTVQRVELEYLNQRYQEYFVPVYSFYVEIPAYKELLSLDEEFEDRKFYSVFHVPAIEAKYLSVVEDVEVRFN